MPEDEDTMALTLKRRRFTLDEYHRMGESGILGEDDRVELIEGEIIEMSPIGSRHAAIVARIHHLFSTRLGDRAVVWSQNPLLLARRLPRSDAHASRLDWLTRSARRRHRSSGQAERHQLGRDVRAADGDDDVLPAPRHVGHERAVGIRGQLDLREQVA